MTPDATLALSAITEALTFLAASPCSCEPPNPVCTACAAVAAPERLAEAECVAGMMARRSVPLAPLPVPPREFGP